MILWFSAKKRPRRFLHRIGYFLKLVWFKYLKSLHIKSSLKKIEDYKCCTNCLSSMFYVIIVICWSDWVCFHRSCNLVSGSGGLSLSPTVQIVQIKDTITDLNYTVSNTGHSLKSDQIIAKYSHFQTVNDSLWKVGHVNRNILEAIKKSFEGLRLKEASCYSLLLSLSLSSQY